MNKKWLPEWLAGNYFKLCKLSEEHTEKSNFFTFPQAKSFLNTSDEITQKTLWELEIRGLMLKRRSDLNLTEKLYRPVPLDIFLEVAKIYLEFPKGNFEKLSLEKKLALAPWEYAISGSTAAYYYHQYRQPSSVLEIETFPKYYFKWMALLSDKNTIVSPGLPIEETRRAKRYVKLEPMAYGDEGEGDFLTTPDGLRIMKLEPLIRACLAKGALTSAVDVIAMLVSCRKRIDFPGLIRDAWKSGQRELGCVFDAVTAESAEHLFGKEAEKLTHDWKEEILNSGMVYEPRVYPTEMIAKYTELDFKLKTPFSDKPVAEGASYIAAPIFLTLEEHNELVSQKNAFESYQKIGEQWQLKFILPKSIVRKTLDDLGVALKNA